MRIATWNVNGIRARQAQFQEWVEHDGPDVICLQEIKASPAQVPEHLSELPGYWNYWHGSGGYSGVSLHLRRDRFPEQPHFECPEFDFECRMVTAQSGDLLFASIYVPNGGKDFSAKLRFVTALREYAVQVQQQGLSLIFCGDLNITRTAQDVHPQERRPVIGQLPGERRMLEEILEDMVDVARQLEPDNDSLFTWWAPWRQMKQRNIGWRIDYILASPDVARTATGCTVLREVGTSDHAPVVATFELA